MKVASNKVFQRKLETLEIEIPEDPNDHARAKRELILVANLSFGSSRTEEDIVIHNNYFILRRGESISGTGFNPLVYGDVVQVEDLLDDEGYNLA